MTVEQATVALRAFFSTNLETQLKLPYATWERAMVERWRVPPLNNGAPALLYLEQKGIDRLSCNMYEALRAFHVNEFTIDFATPRVVRLWLDMENDYDKVPPEEPEMRMLEPDHRRAQQYYERLNPTEGQRTNRTTFDMGAPKQSEAWDPRPRRKD